MAVKTMKYEVWVSGRLLGKRSSSAGREYTHAIVGRPVTKWHPEKPEGGDNYNSRQLGDWYAKRAAIEVGELTALGSYIGNPSLVNDRVREFMGKGYYRDVAAVPVTLVEQWSKVDEKGFLVVPLVEAAESFLTFMANFLGGSQWEELHGANGANYVPQLAELEAAIDREKERLVTRSKKAIREAEEHLARAQADRVDGYDRDDLGESPDY